MKKVLFLLALFASQVTIAGLPFREAVVAGNTVYLSGQIGEDSSGSLVSGGTVAETRQAMENIKAVLAKYHLSLNNLSKCTVFLASMSEWSQMNEVYASYFADGEYPARSSFGANGLAMGAHVEIECIATIPAGI